MLHPIILLMCENQVSAHVFNILYTYTLQINDTTTQYYMISLLSISLLNHLSFLHTNNTTPSAAVRLV